MPVTNLSLIAREATQESTGVFHGIEPIGSATGAMASLGAVVGLVVAAFWKTIRPTAKISYGEWIAYSGALVGLFALVVELAYRGLR